MGRLPSFTVQKRENRHDTENSANNAWNLNFNDGNFNNNNKTNTNRVRPVSELNKADITKSLKQKYIIEKRKKKSW